jgi:hypothetical protein
MDEARMSMGPFLIYETQIQPSAVELWGRSTFLTSVTPRGLLTAIQADWYIEYE